MLIADDTRQYVHANAAACRMLGVTVEELARRRIDDFIAPENRPALEEQWATFLANGALEGVQELWLPADRLLRAEFSAMANVLPGRHLSILMPLAGGAGEEVAGGGISREAAWSRLAPGEAPRLRLSKREREVVGLVRAGLRSAEIAERLVVSSETVKSHVHNAMTKLGARTRAHAVAIALETGQLDYHETRKGPFQS